MDETLKKFAMLASSEQKKLEAHIEREGGTEEFLKDDEKLRALLKEVGLARPHAGASGNAISQAQDGSEPEDFLHELGETAEEAMEKNMDKFAGKLKTMEANILRGTEKIVEREGDRVITDATDKTPQNSILDNVSGLRLKSWQPRA
jgi:hypothetical protein